MTSNTAPLSAHELRDAMRQTRGFDRARLNRILRTDEEQGLVEVQAGTPWRTVAERLRPQDDDAARVGRNLPDVGTSVAWNAAGPDGRPAVTHVESLTLVTPDGELRRASRVANGELFALAVGGQGLFGTLYRVTLRTQSLARAMSDAAPVEVREGAACGGPARRLQLLVPSEALQAFLAETQAHCEAWRLPPARIELRPTLHEEETVLRWARRAFVQVSLSVPIPATLGGCVRTAQLCGELIDACIERGGSFSIAQTLDASREQVDACYPGMRRFLAEKRRTDPAEKLVTPWYRHYRSLFSRQPCESRWNAQA
jgi:hypothetical protein